MKKILLVFMCLLILCGCHQGYDDPKGESADMSGYRDLQSDRFVEISVREALDLMKSRVTVAFYFGYSDCPVCNALIPVLNETLLKKDVRVYYIDMKNENNLSDYDSIDSIISICADYYGDLADEEKGMPMPSVIYFKNGKLTDVHIGTINDRTVNQSELSDRQIARLRYNLEKEIDAIIE